MKSPDNIRVLLLAGQGQSSKIVYHFLAKDFPNLHVVLESAPNKWKMLSNRAKKLGWWTVLGQLLFQIVIVPFIDFFSKKRAGEILEKYNISIAEIPQNSKIEIPSANSLAARQAIQRFQPDVILVNGTRILSTKTLNSQSAKFINTHLGITPLYRGVHGGYWALASGDSPNFGATIHFVDAGVDTGGILAQVFVKPSQGDSFTTYPLLTLAASLPTIKEVLVKVANQNEVILSPPNGVSKQWYHPTLFQYLKILLTRGIR